MNSPQDFVNEKVKEFEKFIHQGDADFFLVEKIRTALLEAMKFAVQEEKTRMIPFNNDAYVEEFERGKKLGASEERKRILVLLEQNAGDVSSISHDGVPIDIIRSLISSE